MGSTPFFFFEIGDTPLSKLTADQLETAARVLTAFASDPVYDGASVKHATRMSALVPRDGWHGKSRSHVPANQSSHLDKIMPMHRPY